MVISTPFSRAISIFTAFAVILWLVAGVFVIQAPQVHGAAAVFTNNPTATTNIYRSNTNIPVLDITLPAIDADTFLDGDGDATAGAGAAGAIAVGDLMSRIAGGAATVCGNTDGATVPANIVHDADGGCAAGVGVRTLILGADVGATFDLSAAVSLVVFRDIDGNDAGVYSLAEDDDLYLDVDDSELFNADRLDALTVRNTGTAVDTVDITLNTVQLWRETTANAAFGVDDTVIDAVCTWDGASDWECNVDELFTTAQAQGRVYVTVNIAANATLNRTIIMQVLALADGGATAGAFDTTETGIFFSRAGTANTGNHDGPGANTTGIQRNIIANPAPPPPVTDSQPPGAPRNVTAAPGENQVTVNWMPPLDSDFASVKIYRSEALGTLGASVATGQLTGSYTDTTAVGGTTYYYTLRSVDTSANESTNVDQVSATPTAPPPPPPLPATESEVTGGCTDGLDNDGDGVIDSEDSDCAPPPPPPEPVAEVCDDGIDNDLDGDIDSADSDCVSPVPPEMPSWFYDGSLIRESSAASIWIIKIVGDPQAPTAAFIRHVLTDQMAVWYPHLAPFWSRVNVVDDGATTDAPRSAWIRLAGDARVWEVNDDATKHWITCADDAVAGEDCAGEWVASGRDANGIYTVNQAEFDYYTASVNVIMPDVMD